MGRFSALVIALLLLPFGHSFAEDNGVIGRENSTQPNDPPQISLDQEHGFLTDSNLNVSGRIIDESLPEYLYWNLYYDQLTLPESSPLGGQIWNISQEEDTTSSARSTWTFQIDVDISDFMPCACELIVRASDGYNDDYDSRIIFAADGSDIPARTVLEKISQSANSRLTGEVIFEGHALSYGHNIELIQWHLSSNIGEDVQCPGPGYLPHVPPALEWNNNSEIGVDGGFSISIDTQQFDEGDYTLFVRPILDESTNAGAVCSCLSFKTDNSPPTANITGPSNLSESNGEVSFDGSGSSDHYWGRESLTYLWTLAEDNWGAEDIIFESGPDYSTFEFNTTKSGNYSLTLTVADNAGFSSSTTHQFEISNTAPVADLRIDGQRLQDGGVITLPDENQWWIDCSGSTDTANDYPLRCTWYLNDEALLEGSRRQLQRPDVNTKPHYLKLEVTDDDGATDTISVSFGIKGTDSDPAIYGDEDSESRTPLILFSAFAIFALLAVGIIIIRKRKGPAIPKWSEDSDV